MTLFLVIAYHFLSFYYNIGISSYFCYALQISRLSEIPTCATTSKLSGKMASSGWIADRAKDIMTTEPNIGPKALQDRLEKKYNVTLRSGRTWEGLQKAKDDIHGSWEASFQLLWSFKAEIERSMPGSIVDINVNAMGEKVFFRRLFVALKPCIDGFLLGCRPYLGCDSSFLTRKYTWQIAAAVGVDGHNWLFPMAYAIFDKENYENWEWFMQRLKQAVGTRDGLVIHTDACKGCKQQLVMFLVEQWNIGNAFDISC